MKARTVLFCIIGVAHAETQVDVIAPRCTDPTYANCAGMIEGAACSLCFGGVDCTCMPSVCDDDGGAATQAMQCTHILICKDEASCVGKKEGAACGSDGFTCTLSGGCWKHTDGGYEPSSDLHCTRTATPADAGTMPQTSSSGCSCTSSGSPGRAWSPALVALALLRRRRR